MDKIHVQAPEQVMFLCGGEISDLKERVPKSIRDAFLKIADNPPLRKRRLVQAEDIGIFYLARAAYRDFLHFETDLAQIAELVVIICESSGSLAELGAFSMVTEIAERLFVVIRDKHYIASSFVRLGPLLSLQNAYGEDTIFVLDDEDINIIDNKPDKIDISKLRERLSGPLSVRIERLRDPTTFNEHKSGHIIKLIVGCIQEWGALTIPEIEELLFEFRVLKSQAEISAYLLCAEAVSWIKEEKKGLQTYYFALPLSKDAASFSYRPTAPETKKAIRRKTIRDHWRQADEGRYRGIIKYLGGKHE